MKETGAGCKRPARLVPESECAHRSRLFLLWWLRGRGPTILCMRPRNVLHVFSTAVQRGLERDAFEHAGALSRVRSRRPRGWGGRSEAALRLTGRSSSSGAASASPGLHAPHVHSVHVVARGTTRASEIVRSCAPIRLSMRLRGVIVGKSPASLRVRRTRLSLRSQRSDPLHTREGVHPYHFGVRATGGNPRQRFRVSEPLSRSSHLPPVATGCDRSAP